MFDVEKLDFMKAAVMASVKVLAPIVSNLRSLSGDVAEDAVVEASSIGTWPPSRDENTALTFTVINDLIVGGNNQNIQPRLLHEGTSDVGEMYSTDFPDEWVRDAIEKEPQLLLGALDEVRPDVIRHVMVDMQSWLSGNASRIHKVITRLESTCFPGRHFIYMGELL